LWQGSSRLASFFPFVTSFFSITFPVGVLLFPSENAPPRAAPFQSQKDKLSHENHFFLKENSLFQPRPFSCEHQLTPFQDRHGDLLPHSERTVFLKQRTPLSVAGVNSPLRPRKDSFLQAFLFVSSEMSRIPHPGTSFYFFFQRKAKTVFSLSENKIACFFFLFTGVPSQHRRWSSSPPFVETSFVSEVFSSFSAGRNGFGVKSSSTCPIIRLSRPCALRVHGVSPFFFFFFYSLP